MSHIKRNIRHEKYNIPSLNGRLQFAFGIPEALTYNQRLPNFEFLFQRNDSIGVTDIKKKTVENSSSGTIASTQLYVQKQTSYRITTQQIGKIS